MFVVLCCNLHVCHFFELLFGTVPKVKLAWKVQPANGFQRNSFCNKYLQDVQSFMIKQDLKMLENCFNNPLRIWGVLHPFVLLWWGPFQAVLHRYFIRALRLCNASQCPSKGLCWAYQTSQCSHLILGQRHLWRRGDFHSGRKEHVYRWELFWSLKG